MNMGFSCAMIEALFEYEVIEDSNMAVDFLIKGNNGWTHKFKDNQQGECIICKELDIEH